MRHKHSKSDKYIVLNEKDEERLSRLPLHTSQSIIDHMIDTGSELNDNPFLPTFYYVCETCNPPCFLIRKKEIEGVNTCDVQSCMWRRVKHKEFYNILRSF
jgi:hypothetical protein